jgi:hypothetical protein
MYNIGAKFAGSTWYVYDEKNDPANKVVKRIGGVWWMSKDELEEMLRRSQIASDIGVGPHVYHTCIVMEKGNPVGYIVMDKLFQIRSTTPGNLNKADIKDLLTRLEENGIKYTDFNLTNFIYGYPTKESPASARWFIIDYE